MNEYLYRYIFTPSPSVLKLLSWWKDRFRIYLKSFPLPFVSPCRDDFPCFSYLWCCPSLWPWTWHWAPVVASATCPACGSRPWAGPPHRLRSCDWLQLVAFSLPPPWSSAPAGSPAWAECEHPPNAAETLGPEYPPHQDPAGYRSKGHSTTASVGSC